MKSSGASASIPTGSSSSNAAASIELTNKLLQQMDAELKAITASTNRVRGNFAAIKTVAQSTKQAIENLRSTNVLTSSLEPKAASALIAPLQRVKALTSEILDRHSVILGRVRTWTELLRTVEMQYKKITLMAGAVHGTIDAPIDMVSAGAATQSLIRSAKNRPAAARRQIVSGAAGRDLTGGPQGGAVEGKGWMSGLRQQIGYWGRLNLLYRGVGKITQGARSFLDMEGEISRAVRTAVVDTSDYNEVMLAREQILKASMAYLSQHTGDIKQYTEVVYKLTEAEMKRSEALKLAPTVMALATGLDAPIDQTTQLLVGLNELYKTSIPGSDSARINKFAGMLALASKKEMASVSQLTSGVAYFGAVANQVGMPIEQLIALISRLNTNMLTGSKAGTGLRQALNSIAKHADKLQASFGISIDRSKPLDTLDILAQLRPQLEGNITTDTLQNLLGFSDVRALPSILLASRQAENIKRLAGELKSASLENVFSMRDIMETNVPAQLGILSKNMDYLVGSFLRGALGGDKMAQSLAGLNQRVSSLQPVLYAAGQTIRDTLGNPVSLGLLTTIGVLKLVQARIAAVAAASTAAQAAGTTFGAGSATLAALGGPVGVAALAIGAAGAVAYASERRKANLAREVDDAGRAEDAYRSQAARLNDMADALESGAASSDQFNKAQQALGKSVAETSGNMAGQVKSAGELAVKLREQAGVLERLARIEGRNVVAAIIAKRNDQGIAPGWARSLSAGFAPVAGDVAKAVESTRDLSDLLSDLDKLRDAGQRAVMSRSAIEDAARAAAAPTLAQLDAARAQAQRLLTPASGVAVSADQRGGVLAAIAQLDDAARVVTGSLENLFTVQETKAAQATASVNRYAEALRQIRDQFADYSPDLRDRLQLIEREDITDAEKYRRTLELLTAEMTRLDYIMKNARTDAAGIADPKSKDDMKSAQKQVAALQKTYASASKERFNVEQQIAALRLDSEKRAAAAAADAAKRQTTALETYRAAIARLNDDAGKINQQLLQGAAEIGQRLFVGVDRTTGTGKDKKTVRFRGAAAAQEIAAQNLTRYQNAQIIKLMQKSRLHDAFARRLSGAGLGEADAANMMGAFRTSPSMYWETQRAGAKSSTERAAIAEQEQRFATILAAAYAEAQRTGTPLPPLATLAAQGLPGLANYYAGGKYSANLQDEQFWAQLGGKGDPTGGLITALTGNQTELQRNSAALAALTTQITGRPYAVSAPWMQPWVQPTVQPTPPASIARPGLGNNNQTITVQLGDEVLGVFAVNAANGIVQAGAVANQALTTANSILQAGKTAQAKAQVLSATSPR